MRELFKAVPLTAKYVLPLKPLLRAPRIEDWATIFNMVADNIGMNDICNRMGLHKHTVNYRIASDPNLSREYMMARARRADTIAEKVLSIADKVVAGELDSSRARAAIPAYQWAASQMGPKEWGQSTVKTEITGKDGKDLNIGPQVVIFQLPDNTRDRRLEAPIELEKAADGSFG